MHHMAYMPPMQFCNKQQSSTCRINKTGLEWAEFIAYISKGKHVSYFIHTVAFLCSLGFSSCSELLSQLCFQA